MKNIFCFIFASLSFALNAINIDGKLDELKGKKVGVILCGGNIDMPVLGRVIERGLTADGRIHRPLAHVEHVILLDTVAYFPPGQVGQSVCPAFP